MITENDGRFDRLTDRKVPVTEPILRSLNLYVGH